MPVSLEQWRASVGAINASGSRALARCVVRPQHGLGEGVFQLFLFLLVACSCAGVWLAVKWTVSLVLLLKGCRRRSTWKQLALLIVSSVGGFFSSAVRPDGGLFLGCVSTYAENFSPPSSMDGCDQSSDIAFHIAVMNALLYLSGDVEKNPGPLQLFDLCPSNADKLLSLLSLCGVDVYKLKLELDGSLNFWLSQSPSWSELAFVLRGLGYVKLSQEIRDSCKESLQQLHVQQQWLPHRRRVLLWDGRMILNDSIRFGIVRVGRLNRTIILLWDPEDGFTGQVPVHEDFFANITWRRLQPPHKCKVLLQQRARQRMLEQERLADLQAQDLLDEATKNGYVTSQSIVIVLVGIAGSGKSSFKRLILNLPPEKDRISTPLAEATIRNLSISRAVIGDSDTVNWEVVDSEQLLKMVADAIKEVGATKETAARLSSSPPVHHFDSKLQDQNSSNSPVIAKRSMSHGHAEQQGTDEEFDSRDDHLLQLIRKAKGSGRLLGVHWVYIIDTGGQPQFLQLLPAFIRNISSCVCFVRLDQGLDEKPMVKFFEKSGQQCGKSYPSEHTNLQLVESCVRTIHSRCCLQSETSPNFFVVGTHRDEYEKCPHPETIDMKNERLTALLEPLEHSLTFYKADDTGKLIFPLNCKTPEKHDKAVAAEFRKCVMNHCPEPNSKIPLAWFILEERIRQYAVKKNMVYVERKICFKIAQKLHMNSETFEVALNHLLKLNIFRSYSSLPNLIFCDTQVVLLKLTEIVRHSFQLQESNIYCVRSEDISFKNEGIISTEFLSRFPQFFSDVFTPDCFIHILRELLAIADLHNGKYFMPCLLKELSEEEFQDHRSSSTSLSTLLLYLDGGCLPNGLFTSLIASLKNDHQWALSKKKHRAACLYQNCVRFRIPGGLPGVVTLIASFSFIEIHLDCSIESKVDKACARVFSDVKSGLESTWRVLYPGTISFKLAFFCSSCAIHLSNAPGSSSQDCPPVIQSHHATVNDGAEVETCSQDDSRVAELCDSKLRWLKNTKYYNIGDVILDTNTSGANMQGSCSTVLHDLLDNVGVGVDAVSSCSNIERDVQLYLSDFEISSSSHLEQTLDWDRKGVDSDLIEIANEVTDWEEKLVAYLQLTDVDVSDIKSQHLGNPKLQRRKALQVWKSNFGLSATYRRLLEICVAAKCDAGARAVCRVLKKKGPAVARGEPPRKKTKFSGV